MSDSGSLERIGPDVITDAVKGIDPTHTLTMLTIYKLATALSYNELDSIIDGLIDLAMTRPRMTDLRARVLLSTT